MDVERIRECLLGREFLGTFNDSTMAKKHLAGHDQLDELESAAAYLAKFIPALVEAVDMCETLTGEPIADEKRQAIKNAAAMARKVTSACELRLLPGSY